jgi:hypothetical protein
MGIIIAQLYKPAFCTVNYSALLFDQLIRREKTQWTPVSF